MKVCSKTGELFLAGYVVGDGEMYIKHEHDLFIAVTEAGYETLDEAYDDEFYYWSEWDLEEVLREDWVMVVGDVVTYELWEHQELEKIIKVPITIVRNIPETLKIN